MRADAGRHARRNRALLVTVVALCLLPLAAAWVLTALLPQWRPFGTVQHGQLVEPPRTITAAGLFHPERGPLAPDYFYGKWTLVLAPGSPCGEACRELLYRTRQARRALGRDMDRVQRLWVMPADAPPEDHAELLAGHPELLFVHAGSSWLQSLPDRSAGAGGVEGVFLVDPRARLMMAYAPDASAEAILDDLRRLLRASPIG